MERIDYICDEINERTIKLESLILYWNQDCLRNIDPIEVQLQLRIRFSDIEGEGEPFKMRINENDRLLKIHFDERNIKENKKFIYVKLNGKLY